MSQKTIVKTMKKNNKSGNSALLPLPPNNFIQLVTQDSHTSIGNSPGTVTQFNANLLAQLEAANLLTQQIDVTSQHDQDNFNDDQPDDTANNAEENDGDEFDQVERQHINTKVRGHQSQKSLQGLTNRTISESLEAPVINESENGFILQQGGISMLAGELLNYDHAHSEFCCSSCKISISLILRIVTEINERLKSTPIIGNYDEAQNHQQMINNQLLPRFPIKKKKTLRAFDEQLSDSDEMKCAFKNQIKTLGGKNLQKTIKAILDYMFTNKFAAASSWTGIHGGVKIKDTVFVTIIRDHLISKYGASHGETKDSIDDRIKEWFQRGSDRLKAEEKKNETVA